MSSLFAQFLGFARSRPIITASIALTAILGAASYILWQDRFAATREHDEARRKGEFMLQALANRARIETDLAALQSAISQIERHLVDEESMEVNLGYFYKLEKPARVRLVRLNQLATVAPGPGAKFRAVPFSMQVSGSYRNTMSFLRALETGPRLLRVRNCSFERSSADSSEFILDLTIEALGKT